MRIAAPFLRAALAAAPPRSRQLDICHLHVEISTVAGFPTTADMFIGKTRRAAYTVLKEYGSPRAADRNCCSGTDTGMRHRTRRMAHLGRCGHGVTSTIGRFGNDA